MGTNKIMLLIIFVGTFVLAMGISAIFGATPGVGAAIGFGAGAYTVGRMA